MASTCSTESHQKGSKRWGKHLTLTAVCNITWPTGHSDSPNSKMAFEDSCFFFSLPDLHDSPAKRPGKLFQAILPSLPPEEFLYLSPVEQTWSWSGMKVLNCFNTSSYANCNSTSMYTKDDLWKQWFPCRKVPCSLNLFRVIIAKTQDLLVILQLTCYRNASSFFLSESSW